MADILKAIDLEFSYSPDKPLLTSFNMSVAKGEFLGLIGPNGSEKTTILRLLSGFLTPHLGNVELKGIDISMVANRTRAQILGVVPQLVSTPMPYTVQQVIEMGRTSRLPLFAPLSAKDHSVVKSAIHDMDLDDLRNHQFNEISGGERQRTIIASALAQEPEILLLDEPTAALDLGHKIKLMRILKKLQERGMAIMVISHDIELMARYCDTMTMLHKGKVIASGKANEILNPELIKKAYDCEVTVTISPGNIAHINPVI